MKKIVFRRDSRIGEAAAIKRISENGLTMTVLFLLILLGSLSLVYILLDLVSNIDFIPDFLGKLFLPFGLMAFFFYVFLKNYHREIEEKIMLPEGEEIDLYKVSSLELVGLYERLGGNPDLVKLFGLAMSTKRVNFILTELGVSREEAAKYLVPVSNQQYFDSVFSSAVDIAKSHNAQKITSADVFWGYCKSSPSLGSFLTTLDLAEEDLANIVFWSNNLIDKFDYRKRMVEKMKKSSSGLAESLTAGYTLALDRFSVDLGNPGYFGGFSVEGRSKELAQMENILSKEAKNNLLLVGEVGVGKTTIVQGLAEKIYWGEVPPTFAHYRVVMLDAAALLSGASGSGDVQERLRSVLSEAVRAGNVILFIDDIHTILNAGSKVGSVDASEVLMPFLAEPTLRVIGATTQSSFETYIQPKGQLAGYFEKVILEPADRDQTIKILEDLSLYFSQKYKIRITYNALKEIYTLAERFVTGKGFPAKAIDLLESACSGAKNRGENVLNASSLDVIAEQSLNVPVAQAGKDEKEKLLSLESKLHERVIGQEEAIAAVSDALRRARAQVSQSKKPIGSFLFLGPTGVGKTELAKALAAAYFGDEDSMIRVDMSEYQTIDSIDRFIGRKIPDREELEGGDFVKKVREKPFSVILLDELEKAHPDLLNLFLQVLDEGFLTDGMGQKIIFTNSIIIATSNAGANEIRKAVESKIPADILKETLLKYLQESNIYRPEFLNRFDSLVVFKPLTKAELSQVATLILKSFLGDMKSKGFLITIEADLPQKIVDWGYQPELGARPMKRAFQDKFESYIAKKVLDGSLQKGVPSLIKTSELEVSRA